MAPLAAVWLLVFAMPMFLFTPDGTRGACTIVGAMRAGLKEMLRTLRTLPHYRNAALYLLARMFFNDGMGGVLTFGGVYAAGTFDWETIEMLAFGIITSASAAIGAMIVGKLDDALGSRKTVLLAVGGTAGLLWVGVTIAPDALLFALAGTAAAFLGPLVVGWFTVHFQSQRALVDLPLAFGISRGTAAPEGPART